MRNHHNSLRARKARRLYRYLFLRFLRLRGSAESIARGLAVGAFAGMFPIFGGQTVIGILLALLVKGNKVAAIAATWISNPLTYIPLYAVNYHIGRHLRNVEPATIDQQNIADLGSIFSHGLDFALALLLGSCVTGTAVALLAYLLGYRLTARLRARQRKRNRLASKVPTQIR